MKQAAQDKEMSFEEALAELESIVQKLETGQVKLDESVRFYERGILVNANVNKDLFAGIARVKSYFRGNSASGAGIYIFENCVHLIRELKGYFWGEGDIPRKKDDHALDELRYYLMTKPKNEAPALPQTAVQKDKMRLIRKLSGKRRSGE